MSDDIQELTDAAANIGALMNELEDPTETELFLLNLVQDLCGYLIDLAEAYDALDN
jgi:hypothetical protein